MAHTHGLRGKFWKEVEMIDISEKSKTLRYARAEGFLSLSRETIERIKKNDLPKKNPLEVARVAGILAGKKTWEIIPYCHPVPVEWSWVDFEFAEDGIKITAEVKGIYRTGVEMEALTILSVSVLTLYDMLKPVEENMVIREMRVVEKKGGKKDFTEVYEKPLRAAVIVTSDSVSAGKKQDRAGIAVIEKLKKYGVEIAKYTVIPDEPEQIRREILYLSDHEKVDLILTSGGTGLGPRDVTVDVTKTLIEREIPGIPEAVRTYGMERTPYSMLSRAVAGVRGKTVIINLPGSTRGATESMNALFPGLLHIFRMIAGGGHKE